VVLSLAREQQPRQEGRSPVAARLRQQVALWAAAAVRQQVAVSSPVAESQLPLEGLMPAEVVRQRQEAWLPRRAAVSSQAAESRLRQRVRVRVRQQMREEFAGVQLSVCVSAKAARAPEARPFPSASVLSPALFSLLTEAWVSCRRHQDSPAVRRPFPSCGW
jgi:hypothetical protein